MRSSAVNWIRKNSREMLLIAVVLVVGAFFRLYRIDEYMMFLGDEGRDAVIVRKILTDFNLVFVGPGTSIGNMYLGPLYYYMMAPALWLAKFSPVGPSVQIAILGVMTIFLIWFIDREWFGKTAGLVAASLYAISPIVIIYSRSSWNPNIMPFFALLTIYSLWRVWQKRKWGWLIISGVSFAFVLQSHYLGLILTPVILIFWILSFKNAMKNREEKYKAIRYSLVCLGLLLLLMSPLAMFDAKHGWRNLKAIQAFFSERQGSISFSTTRAIERIWPVFEKANTRLVAATDETAGLIVSLTMLAFLILAVTRIIKEKFNFVKNKAWFLLTLWMGFGILGLSLYRDEIYDHYYGFLFPAPFLIIGALAQNIEQRTKNIGKILLVAFYLMLISISLLNNPLKYSPNRQLQRSVEIANKVFIEAKNEKFNFAVIAEKNYEGAYRYFLDVWGAPISDIDPQRYQETVTEQLFVVCEYAEKEKCQPTSNPKAEVANFGWSKIDKQWNVAGVILFRLVHNRL